MERRLAANGSRLGATVLKVPHHGSRYNLYPGLICHVIRPRVAIVSAARRGEGRFKALPDEDVERMLARDVRRTHYTYNGSCVVAPHGAGWKVEQLDDIGMHDVPSPPSQ